MFILIYGKLLTSTGKQIFNTSNINTVRQTNGYIDYILAKMHLYLKLP